MAHALLQPRNLDDPRPALLPLEPLSTLDQANSETHLTASLDTRDLLEATDEATHQLARRALRTNVIPLSYNTFGAKPGVVVGATLGAIVGFLLLMWLIWTLTRARGTGAIEGDDVGAEEIHIHRRSRRSDRSRRTRTHRSEMSERSRSSVAPPPRRRERILVEERTRRERSRMPGEPAPPPPMSPEREIHEVEVEEERRVSGDDVVEVIEEASDMTPEPPRRKKSGYRTVDPNEYAGGNFEQREVYESDRRRSSKRRP